MRPPARRRHITIEDAGRRLRTCPRALGQASLGYQADADAKCAPLIPVESQYREQGTLLLLVGGRRILAD